MSRLSPHEIRKVEEEMDNEVKPPQNNLAASRYVNDYMNAPGRTTIPRVDIRVMRALAQERDRLGREPTADELAAVLAKIK